MTILIIFLVNACVTLVSAVFCMMMFPSLALKIDILVDKVWKDMDDTEHAILGSLLLAVVSPLWIGMFIYGICRMIFRCFKCMKTIYIQVSEESEAKNIKEECQSYSGQRAQFDKIPSYPYTDFVDLDDRLKVMPIDSARGYGIFVREGIAIPTSSILGSFDEGGLLMGCVKTVIQDGNCYAGRQHFDKVVLRNNRTLVGPEELTITV